MSDDAALRARICAEALNWLGTPYHSHARIKGVGVDCAQLPIAVYHAVGAIPDLRPQYAREWMEHHDEELYLAHVREWATEIDRAAVGPGDLAVFKFARTFSHSAVIITPGECVHAYAKARRVALGNYDRDIDLAERPVRFFSIFTKGE